MKTIKLWGLLALTVLGGCSTVTLVDESMITFHIQTTKNKESSVEISWPKQDFYKSYDVLRSESLIGAFMPVSSRQTAHQYTDNSVQPGKIYYYKVKGYNSKGIGAFTSEAEQGFAGGGSIYPPKTVSASAGLYGNKVFLSWSKSEKALSYKVRRSEAGADIWSIIADNITWTTYEDTSAALGKIYDYSILAVDKEGYTSLPSGVVQGYKLENSSQFSANAGLYADYNLLTWKTPPNTVKIVIHRSASSSILGESIAVLGGDALSYKDRAAPGSWYYTVRFYDAGGYLIVETPRQEGFRLNLTVKPQNTQATKGSYLDKVRITWEAVKDADAYTVQRSFDNSAWSLVGASSSTSLDDTSLPKDKTKAFYRVSVTIGESQGPYSDSSEGWAHRAPLNLRPQKVFGNRAELIWDASPDAQEYEILFSASSPSGPFTSAGTSASANYTHYYTVSGDEQQLYYTVRVKNLLNIWSQNSYQDYGSSAGAWISKAKAPIPLIENNKTALKTELNFKWAESRAAVKYKIYRAALMHGGADISGLSRADYKYVGETPNASYNDALSAAPIRRYRYKIALVDGDGNEYPAFAADSSGSQIAYRLPVDVKEMMIDADFNIIEAQMRIANFGNNGSSGAPKGRWRGYYDYKAAMTGSKSLWEDFSSFETVLNSQGNHKIAISFSPLGAKQNGDVDVYGLYTGRITYNNLVGAEGGWSVGGELTGTYNRPNPDGTTTTLSKNYSYTDAEFLQSIVLKGQDKPSYPAYENGAGGSLQAGWFR